MSPKTPIFRPVKTMLLASVVLAGAASYGVSQGGIQLVQPSHAQAVEFEAPKVFSFGDVVEAVSPAVVSVRVGSNAKPRSSNFRGEGRGRDYFERFFQDGPRGERRFERRRGEGRRGGPRRGFSQGSGFFVSEDGYVVTNNHVIENGSDYKIVTNDGTQYDAELVGTDPRTDLAVLKVQEDVKFTYVEFGTDRPRIGDWVVAVGNPFGLGGTVTAGIVSAQGREIGATRYDDFIQIDAAVNKGNSGGPSFDLSGKVIGVNTAIYSPSGGNVGIAFAVPANLAEEVVTEIIEDGSVTRGWLGVQIQRIDRRLADALDLDRPRGAIVTDPQPGSPAEQAGVETGDVIVGVNGEDVRSPRSLSRMIAAFDPDAEVTLNIVRDGEKQDLSVKLGELASDEMARLSDNGDGDDGTKRMGRIGLNVEETQEGIAVINVERGSFADRAGMQPNDVIQQLDGESVTSVKQLREGLLDARNSGKKSALLQIERGDRTVFVPIPVRRRG